MQKTKNNWVHLQILNKQEEEGEDQKYPKGHK